MLGLVVWRRRRQAIGCRAARPRPALPGQWVGSVSVTRRSAAAWRPAGERRCLKLPGLAPAAGTSRIPSALWRPSQLWKAAGGGARYRVGAPGPSAAGCGLAATPPPRLHAGARVRRVSSRDRHPTTTPFLAPVARVCVARPPGVPGRPRARRWRGLPACGAGPRPPPGLGTGLPARACGRPRRGALGKGVGRGGESRK